MSKTANAHRKEIRLRSKELKVLRRASQWDQSHFARQQAIIERRQLAEQKVSELDKSWFLLGREAFDHYLSRSYRKHTQSVLLHRKRSSGGLWRAGYDTAKNPQSGDAVMYEEMGWIPKP